MGILTLTHTFTNTDTEWDAGTDENVSWGLLSSLGDNIIILKSITTVFGAPEHGMYSGYIEGLTEWGFDCIDSSDVAPQVNHKSRLDLRWDGMSQVVSNDMHLLVGRVDSAASDLKVKIGGIRDSSKFLKADKTALATHASAVPVTMTLVFEYNNETFQ